MLPAMEDTPSLLGPGPIESNGVPLYRQVARRLAEQVARGAIAPGTRLPPSRALAAQLGVSRITVVNAYAELQAEGVLTAQVGRGSFVAETVRAQTPADPETLTTGEALRLDVIRHVQRPGTIAFALGTPGPDCLPVAEWRAALDAVLTRDGQAALAYGSAEGYGPLRRWLADWLGAQGQPATAERLLVVTGAQQGIDLVARRLLRPGDVVLSESPTYLGALDVFESARARVFGVPFDQDGLHLERLELLCRRLHPRLLYLQPTYHNPTGLSLSLARRRQVVALARRHGALVLEDTVYQDLGYGGRRLPSLWTLDDGAGQVIQVGSFSKSLIPGLRVGYILAPAGQHPGLVAAKHACDIATAPLMQRTLLAYFETGAYPRHLRRVRQVYRERLTTMLAALRAQMPPGVRWTQPEGGLFVWVTLPPGTPATALAYAAAQRGVAVTPGAMCVPERRELSAWRLNFTAEPPARIAEGVRLLASVLREHLMLPATERSRRQELREVAAV